MRRPSIDETLMRLAIAWQDRSTCSRNHVGVVIAKDGRSLMSGYNGAPAGMAHCEHPVVQVEYADQNIMPYLRGGNGCQISIHAEANALAYCARNGVAVEGATLYSTLSPCYACSQLIIAAGLVRVVYGRPYRVMDGVLLLQQAGVVVERLI